MPTILSFFLSLGFILNENMKLFINSSFLMPCLLGMSNLRNSSSNFMGWGLLPPSTSHLNLVHIA